MARNMPPSRGPRSVAAVSCVDVADVSIVWATAAAEAAPVFETVTEL
jgi:hypothetical protein